MPAIKICGITNQKEAEILNKNEVSYAGFVLYEKSKRYVSIQKTKEIFDKLNQNITKVAVTVTPDVKLVKQIEYAGFDVIQIHRELERAVREEIRLPIWRAVNISDGSELETAAKELECMDGKLQALVLDAKEYGSGKTFGWEDFNQKESQFWKLRDRMKDEGIQVVLAGGLYAGNVERGIRIFLPDIVDVSTGVELEHTSTIPPGKEEEKIRAFVHSVQQTER